MDDRGRLAQPLKGTARWRSRLADHTAARAAPPGDDKAMRPSAKVTRVIERWSSFLNGKWPRGVGVTATVVMILASLAYGTVKGDHVPTIIAGIKGAREGIASAAGFRIVSIALAGNHRVSREEVLATAGITGTTSLLFLDVDQTRERLRPIRGSRTPRCSSSIPTSCRLASRNARPLRCGKRTGTYRSSPMTAPYSNLMSRRV